MLFRSGFVDDYLGVRRGRNLGLRKRGKTAGQLLLPHVARRLMSNPRRGAWSQ